MTKVMILFYLFSFLLNSIFISSRQVMDITLFDTNNPESGFKTIRFEKEHNLNKWVPKQAVITKLGEEFINKPDNRSIRVESIDKLLNLGEHMSFNSENRLTLQEIEDEFIQLTDRSTNIRSKKHNKDEVLFCDDFLNCNVVKNEVEIKNTSIEPINLEIELQEIISKLENSIKSQYLIKNNRITRIILYKNNYFECTYLGELMNEISCGSITETRAERELLSIRDSLASESAINHQITSKNSYNTNKLLSLFPIYKSSNKGILSGGRFKRNLENDDKDNYIVLDFIIKRTTTSMWQEGKISYSLGKFLNNSIFNLSISSLPICKNIKTTKEVFNCASLIIYLDDKFPCLKTPHCRDENTIISTNGENCVEANCANSFSIIKLPEECSTLPIKSTRDISFLEETYGLKACRIEYGGIFKEYKKCVETKAVKELVDIVFSNNNFIFIKDVNLKKEKRPDLIESYSCNRECGDGQCTGDEVYIRTFHGGKRQEFCEFNKNVYQLTILINNEKIPVDCIFQKEAIVYYEVLQLEKQFQIDLSCSAGFIDYNLNNIDIRTMLVSDNRTNKWEFINSTQGRIKLPYSLMYIGKNLSIKMYSISGKTITRTLFCDSEVLCEKIDCYLCKEKLTSVHCFSSLEWCLYILFILILVFITIKIIMKFPNTLKYSLNCLVYLFFKFSRILTGHCFRKKKKNDKTKLEASRNSTNKMKVNVYLGNGTEKNYERQIVQSKKDEDNYIYLGTPKRNDSNVYYFTILFFLFTLNTCISQNCQDFSSIIANSKTCSTLDKTKCLLNSVIDLNLAPKGSSVCFNVKDKSDNILHTYNIETIDLRLSCSEDLLYYVPEVILNCKSYHECAENCDKNLCNKISKNNLTHTAFNNIKNKLSRQSCNYVCGCAGCGCFLCTEACLYSVFYFENKEKIVYKVSKCIEWNYEVDLKITVTSLKNVKEYQITVRPNIISKVSDLNINLISVTNTEKTFLSNCLITDINDKVHGIGPCNNRGELVKGKIGEIQCPNLESARMTDNLCFYNSDIVNIYPKNDHVDCSLNKIEIKEIIRNNQLPKYYQSGVLHVVNDILVFDEVNSDTFNLRINLKDVEISMIFEESTCYFTLIQLTGCYDCSSGAMLTGSIKTDKGSSLGSITCPSSYSPALFTATTKETKIKLNLNFKQSNINDNCEVQCSGGLTKVNIKGNLIYIPNSNPSSDTYIITNPDGTKNFDVGSLFGTTWFKYLIILIVFVLLLLGLIVTFKFLRIK